MNLEEKVEFLYRNYENENKGVGEDKLILKNLKTALQYQNSCKALVENIRENHPDKQILVEKLSVINQFINQQLSQLIEKITRDLEVFFQKLKGINS